MVYEPVPPGGAGPGRGAPMRRGQPDCHMTGWCVGCLPHVSEVTERVCPGRWAGRLPGRCPGSLDVPAHLPALTAVKPQARREMYLRGATGTDD